MERIENYDFQVVLMPYLPHNWEEIVNCRAASILHPRQPMLTDLTKHTFLGNAMFTKSTFDFLQMRIIRPRDTIKTLKTHIGTAWVNLDDVNDDSALVTRLVTAGNQYGSYSFYPSSKNGADDVAKMQYGAAMSNAGLLQSLMDSPEISRTLVRHLTTPSGTKPYKYDTLNSFAEPGKPAMVLASTCRLLRSEIKSMWLKDRVFMFYDPQQLIRFLRCILPKTTLLAIWPPLIKHIVITVKTCDADPVYLRQANRTTVVPLACSLSAAPKDEPKITKEKQTRTADIINNGAHNNHHVTDTVLSNKTLTLTLNPHQLSQPPAASQSDHTSTDATLSWLNQVQEAIFAAHGPELPNHANRRAHWHGLSSAHRLSLQDLAGHKIAHHQEQHDAWVEGLTTLLRTYRVGRLDVVYDDRSSGQGRGWQYVEGDNGEKSIDVHSVTGMAEDRLKTFMEPHEQLQEVLAWVHEIF